MNHSNEQHRDESAAGAEPSHESRDTTGSGGGGSRLWLTALTAPHFHFLYLWREPTSCSSAGRRSSELQRGALCTEHLWVALLFSHTHTHTQIKHTHSAHTHTHTSVWRAHHQSSTSQYPGKSIRREFQSPSVSNTCKRTGPWWSTSD